MKKIFLLIFCISQFSLIWSQNNRWDSTFTISNSLHDTVFCTTLIGKNIYVGGTFDSVSNILVNKIAMFDGNQWNNLGTGINGNVYALASNNSIVIAGGNFTNAGGVSAVNLAMWNGTTWSALSSACNGTIRALEIHNQYLYVGGDFTSINGIPANHIARFDGTTWEALGAGTNGPVYTINYANNLIIGGNFLQADGVTCNNVATWNGTSWLQLGNGFDGPVYSIDANVGIGAPVYVGGSFTNSGATTLNNVSFWDGTSWNMMDNGINGVVYSIKIAGNSVFATGSFSLAGVQAANNIAEYKSSAWTNLGDGLNNTGYNVNNYYNELVCGGIFNTAGLNPSFFFGRYFSAPEITTQSNSMFICENDTVTFFANSFSFLPLTFQWQKNSSNIGTNNDTLLITSVALADSGSYQCIISNNIGTITSIPMFLHVLQQPSINFMTDLSYCETTSQNISPIIIGSNPIAYQWFKDGLLDNSQTNASFNLGIVTQQDTGFYFCIAQNSCGIDTTNIFHVSVNPLPVAQFTGLLNSYCENAASSILYGTPTGGVFSGNGITDSIFSPNGLSNTVVITYTYTDSNSCAGVYIDSTNVYALPFISFTGLNLNYCFNSDADTVSASLTGGIFSGNGLIDSVFYPSLAGSGNQNIFYIYNDVNGCVDTVVQSTFIYGTTVFTYNALDTSFCSYDTSYTFDVYPSGGYFTGTAISGNVFNPQVSGTGSFDILYNYTDTHGCVNVDTTTVIVHQIPSVQIVNLNNSYCHNQTYVALTGNPSGGTFTGPGISANVLNPSFLTPGSYNVYYLYTDSFGCVNSDTANYNLLTAADVYFTGLNSLYCPYDNNDTLTGYPSGGTFTGNGIAGNVFFPNIPQPGTIYISYVFDNLNGCISTDSASVIIYQKPNIQLPNDTTICTGQSLVINSIGDPGNYVWSTLDTTTSINVNPISNTTYTVTVYNAYCNNSDTINVFTNPAPVLNLGSDTTVCLPYNINSNGGYSSYLWSNGSSDSSTTIYSSGTYSLTVTNAFNCSSADNVVINANPSPMFSLGEDISMFTNQTIIIGTSPSYSSYLWNNASTQNFIVVSGANEGFGVHNYWLTVYNNYGCSYTDTITVNISSVGIDNNNANELFTYFPNPVKSYLSVNCSKCNENEIIKIVNVTGKTIYESTYKDLILNNNLINLSETANGMYFMMLKNNTYKVVKE